MNIEHDGRIEFENHELALACNIRHENQQMKNIKKDKKNGNMNLRNP